MLNLNIPLWINEKGTSGRFYLLGNKFHAYLYVNETKEGNQPDYHLKIIEVNKNESK